jgi:hypothetical protein
MACAGRGPASPAADPTVTPAPNAPTATFAYAPEQHAFVLQTRATVQVRGDTSETRDTVATATYLTYRMADSGRLVGTVDSFTVQGGAAVAAMPTRLMAPIPFGGTVRGGIVRVAVPRDVEADCASPTGALLATARDLLPSVPSPLIRGEQWEDVSTTTACRGGVAIRTVATNHYRVLGRGTQGGMAAVERRTTYVISGSGTQGGQTVEVTGRGESRGEFQLDVAPGRLRGGSSRSRIDLTFTADGRSQQVVQEAEQRLTPLGSTPP